MTLLLLLALAQPAQATPVTPDLVCSVQHAIRWREAAWPHWQCVRVADAIETAFQVTGQGRLRILAVAVNESDLRPEARRWTGPVAEPGSIIDGGLMGVRCVLGKDMRCSNGIVKGMKFPEVLEIETNVLLGARLLKLHGSLLGYNGAKTKTGYPEKIAALEAAFSGVQVHVRNKRVQKLVRQIVSAVKGVCS